MTLGILYHMPFWQTADGALWEAEGSFARYVDSLAPYFDEVILSVPVFDTPPASGSRVRGSSNVTLAPLPYFPGPRQFYPQLPSMLGRLRAWVEQCDVVHLRVPSPAAIFAFRIARRRQKPVFLLVVGDYAALLPHLGYRGVKKTLFGAYVGVRGMGAAPHDHACADVCQWRRTARQTRAPRRARDRDQDHDAVRRRHLRRGPTRATGRRSGCSPSAASIRAKACGAMPALVASLVAAGIDATQRHRWTDHRVDRRFGARRDSAPRRRRPGVGDRVHLPGPIALDRLMPLYRDYDIFVLPTRPGEGIPRVLLEAMAAGCRLSPRASPASPVWSRMKKTAC